MLGASKKGSTKRFENGGYVPYISKFYYRDEIDFVGRTTLQNKDRHIWRKVHCDLLDIKTLDRIVFQDGTEWVVVTGLIHNDQLGSHLEIPIRQVNSSLHEKVLIRRNAKFNNQPNFDPLLHEYFGEEVATDFELSVLVDVIDKDKEKFLKFIEPGKLESIDYVLTLDYPDNLEITDAVNYNGLEYNVSWRVELPYEILIGITRHIKSFY